MAEAAMGEAVAALAAALARHGLRLDGEVRGVLSDAGGPLVGWSAPVGAGVPAGWGERRTEGQS